MYIFVVDCTNHFPRRGSTKNNTKADLLKCVKRLLKIQMKPTIFVIVPIYSENRNMSKM